jgi:hypothetical protein
MQIIELSATNYQEQYLYPLEVSHHHKYEGIHTISSHDNTSLIDIKYYKFSWVNFKYMLQKKLRIVKPSAELRK